MACYLDKTHIPMESYVKRILNIIDVIIVIFWLLNVVKHHSKGEMMVHEYDLSKNKEYEYYSPSKGKRVSVTYIQKRSDGVFEFSLTGTMHEIHVKSLNSIFKSN